MPATVGRDEPPLKIAPIWGCRLEGVKRRLYVPAWHYIPAHGFGGLPGFCTGADNHREAYQVMSTGIHILRDQTRRNTGTRSSTKSTVSD